ncbi:MAG: phenylalanine--tRNA ligase subunit beta [Candidatus Omnitrophica bacterium]|nr:phenylalanine--tRNA ligase subunit beta [Candidatus Omnitrophota bacterium]
MKLPYSWLNELAFNLPSPEKAAEILTMRGLEVEEISSVGEEIKDVVVAKILDMKPHPNADKLTVCHVSDGKKDYSIVCGAKNMKTGDCVALARVGVVLPGNFKIEKRKLRGEKSEGMLCSSRELNLGDDHSGIMILPEDSPLGARLIDVLGFNEVIFDINVTPNRPDALSAIGVVRELAAACGAAIHLPDASPLPADASPDFVPSITLEDEDLCPRYTGLVLRDVQIGPSPEWLKNRLEACGVRSINNVVDCTNLVLLEMGQPLHAFDMKKLHGERIVVRRARPGELIRTIDDEKRTLDEDMLVIADAEHPTAVAGVMGGLETEVSDTTTTIFLESAFFHPPSIRRTSKKLGLSSEASYRFERGVDFESVIPAAYRCARLMVELAGAKIAGRMGIADTKDQSHLQRLGARKLSLHFDYCNRLLGQEIDPDKIADIFQSLQIEVIERDADSISVRVPSFRQDISRQADLVEEVARCYGYNEFAPTLLYAPVSHPEPQKVDRKMVSQLRDYLTGEGLCEAVTYSFTRVDELKAFPLQDADLTHDAVTIQNPINIHESVMRTSLFPALLQAARRNVSRGNSDFGLYEMARGFYAKDSDLHESRVLAAVLVGNPHQEWRNQKSEMDFFDLKGIVDGFLSIAGVRRFRALPGPDCLHPKRGVQIQAGKKIIGFYGELHPSAAELYELPGRVLIMEFDLESLTEFYRLNQPAYRSFSSFPSVKRDLALLLPQGTEAQKVEEIIRRECGELLEDLCLFDYYRGKQVAEGRVSAGFRLTLRSQRETLNEEQVDSVVESILETLKKELDVSLRS